MATVEQKANYIIKLVKSVGKTIEYAVDLAGWYTWTDSEQKEVEGFILSNFNN